MNVKKAKALRKLTGFHPTQERVYETLKVYSALGRVTEVPRTRVNGKSPRGLYRALKKSTGEKFGLT